MFKFTRFLGLLPTVVSIVLLSACGGNGDSKAPTKPVSPPTYQISGGGIKGPLKNAKVSLYIYDQTKSTGYGALISVGKTNELTEIIDLEITGSLEEFYILSFESTDQTIDISTQMSPIIRHFDTIVSSADIMSGQATYASPLSHVALALVQLKVSTGVTIAEAMNQSNLIIKSIFGFDISENIDLFSSPSLLIASADSFEEQFKIFQLRKAVEIFSVLSFQLLEALNNADISMDIILEGIAKDIIDGELDGISKYAEQLPYSSEQLSVFQKSVNDLILPNTDDIQISSLITLLIEEAGLLHSETLNTEKLLIEASLNLRDQIILVVDYDNDGIVNAEDNDDDNDGHEDLDDVFPYDGTEWLDTDIDGIGNNADTDDDGDGVADSADAFPLDASESIDTDGDGVGNNADTDDDGDSFLDLNDAFPLDPNEWLDTDGDRIGNNTDSDDDNDGVYDNDDDLPLDATESRDFDKDMIGDNADTDDDNDGIIDSEDYIHVAVPNLSQFDAGELINFNIRGFHTDGSLLSGSESWHVQYYIYDVNMNGDIVPFYTENGYYNASFNSTKNEWNVSFPAPSYSGDFYVEFVLYCSAGSGVCGNHDTSDSYFEKEQRYSFKVNCLAGTCGYQEDPEPGKNISASKISDHLTANVVHSNGDIIAVYLDQAENDWKNYVVKSSNNGYSWNRIGQLPTYVLNGHLIELSQNGELLLIGSCGTSFCLYSSSNGSNWSKQDLFDTSTFANCNGQNCNTNYMHVSDIVEAEDGALMVIYNNRVNGKDVAFVTKSYDRINWSSPVDLFGSEYTTIVHSLITMDNQGYAAVVVSYEDYQATIFTSDDGEEWLPIKSYSFIDSADLIYQNGILRLFYQHDYNIFEVHSNDFANFSIPEKIVEKSYVGFGAVTLNNGDLGVIYNLYLNYQYDVFYQNVNLSTP